MAIPIRTLGGIRGRLPGDMGDQESSMTTTTAPKTRTITLTDRAPVKIVDGEWPSIASDRGWSGGLECQANEEWWLKVRQHADGRTIVYGCRDRGPGGMPISYEGVRGGELLAPPANLALAIRRVGESLGIDDYCIAGCIADLPAEVL